MHRAILFVTLTVFLYVLDRLPASTEGAYHHNTKIDANIRQ
jgi:hypothetical protein